ncbi:hypothetical protein [Streptomyces sp. NPDC001999]
MTNTWTEQADIKAEQRYKALVVELPQALASGDHDAARTALRSAADADAWFSTEDVVAYW